MPIKTTIDAALKELASAREMSKHCSVILRSGKEYSFWKGQFDGDDVLLLTLMNGHIVAIALGEVASLHMPTAAPQAGSRGRQM